MRYQAAGDVSCGVQALGMALDGIDGSAPTSNSLLGFLQDQDMMYNFGTGVEELAHAAQNFGYAGSLPFHGWSLDQLSATLAEGKPVVVALGANGADQPGHFVTVTGVSPDGRWVTYNDPTLGKQVISAEEFERLWGLQGSSGVSVATSLPAGAPADYAPWVAFAAGLMALVSTTPLALQRKGIGGMLTAPGGGSNSSSPPYAAPAGKRWTKKTVTKYDWKDVTFTEKVEVPNIVRKWAIVRVNRWIEKVPVYKTVTVDRGRWAYRTVKKYRTERYRTSQRYRAKKSYWYRRNGRFYRGTRYVWKTRTVVKTRRVSYTKRERYWVPKIVQEQRFVRNREIEHRDPVYGWRDEKHGTKMVSVTKTVSKWMPVGTQVKWELEKLPVPPKPDPDFSHEEELLRNRTENYLAQQAAQTSDDPILEPVPSIWSNPGDWLQASLINLGRQNETAQDVMDVTLAPAANWLQTIPDPDQHPFLSQVHNNVPKESAFVLAGTLASPIQGDEAIVAIGIGLIALTTLTISYFAGKNWQPPGSRVPTNNLPQIEPLKQSLSGGQPPPPWNSDPNKQPEDLPPNEIANLKGIGRVIFYISSLAVVFNQLMGEQEGEGRETPLPTPMPTSTPTSTPTLAPTITPTDTPTSTPTSTPTFTPTSTPTPTSTSAPSTVTIGTE